MMRKVKVIAASLIILVSVFSLQVSAAAQSASNAQPIKVFLDGSEIVYDVPPQIIADRTMVPLSSTIQAITGSPAEWNDEIKTVIFYADGHKNVHKIGETVVYVDDLPKSFDSPSLIIDSRTLVPIRMIGETAGCSVQWDDNNRHVIITKDPESAPSAEEPKIISVEPEKTSIRQGDSTELMIKTNSAASIVWVNYDDVSINAVLIDTNADGTKTWAAECSPSESQRLHIFANTAQDEMTAAMEIQFIEVITS